MTKQKKQESGLHPRNLHQSQYDFDILTAKHPELAKHVQIGPNKQQTINFFDADAVKCLNAALLKSFYRINYWDIPENYLCPPIPGRADYIHHLADLLASSNEGEIPTGKRINGLDVGTGANIIYPILGSQIYGWQFVGTDIDPVSIQFGTLLAQANKNLKKNIIFRLQGHPKHTLVNVIKPEERYHFTMCNPPFHTSEIEANAGSQRKQNNLSKNQKSKHAPAPTKAPAKHALHKAKNDDAKAELNFGGRSGELWCPGGEATFIKGMIKESVDFKDQCLWFTSLVSKKDNLSSIYQALKKVNVADVKTINMAQGNKISRFVAWTFQPQDQHKDWF